jgi:putative spermidine/putrescine transport system ATP-binding protein
MNSPSLRASDAARGATSGHSIAVRNITHDYGSSVALAAVSLDIEPGELVALLGPSGCGKTTLLRIIAGFVRQTSGEVLVDGHRIDDVDAGRRGIGIVFQNYALFPHLSVFENVAYGPLAQGMRRSRAREVADEMLDRVRMTELGARLPRELSGGQQQRVALARALAISPRIMLLDEPFSALDKALRLDMQSEVKTILKRSGVTSIMVTHDQEEALSMADRIVVLNRGKVEQIGGSAEIYDRPANLFVGGFIGHMNLLPCRSVRLDDGEAAVELTSGARLRCPAAKSQPPGSAALLGVRPENLLLKTDGPIRARISQVLPLGPTDIVEARMADDTRLRVACARREEAANGALGETIMLDVGDLDRCSVFPVA